MLLWESVRRKSNVTLNYGMYRRRHGQTMQCNLFSKTKGMWGADEPALVVANNVCFRTQYGCVRIEAIV